MLLYKISTGNTKIGRLSNFSLTPGMSCFQWLGGAGNAPPCFVKNCYAYKLYKLRPSVRSAWDSNLLIAMQDAPKFHTLVSEVSEHCIKKKVKYFRVHVAGDFFCKEYVEAWKRIAEANSSTKFLAFTKNKDAIYAEWPANFTRIVSWWPQLGISYSDKDIAKLPASTVVDKTEAQKARDMSGKTDMKEGKTYFLCPGKCDTCKHCWDMKNHNVVMFIKH